MTNQRSRLSRLEGHRRGAAESGRPVAEVRARYAGILAEAGR